MGTHDATELPRICFIHVPKTAGSSVRTFFFNLYGELAFHAYTTLDYQVTGDKHLERHRFFAGHAFRSDWSRLPSDTKFLTILRDPVERAMSLYRYWNAIDLTLLHDIAKENPILLEAVRLARTHSIQEFILSDNAVVRNHLCGAFARQFVPAALVNSRIASGHSAIAAFDEAIQALFSFDAVLTTERLDLTFACAMRHLGLGNLAANLPHENVSAGELSCDRAELRLIMSLVSPIDFHLHAVAKQLEARFL